MKYLTTERFLGDYARLSGREDALFAGVVRRINTSFAASHGRWPPSWPAALRIKPVQGATGVWELTWSFSGPDGRATFEFVTVDAEPAIRWRRIGGHEIFREP